MAVAQHKVAVARVSAGITLQQISAHALSSTVSVVSLRASQAAKKKGGGHSVNIHPIPSPGSPHHPSPIGNFLHRVIFTSHDCAFYRPSNLEAMHSWLQYAMSGLRETKKVSDGSALSLTKYVLLFLPKSPRTYWFVPLN